MALGWGECHRLSLRSQSGTRHNTGAGLRSTSPAAFTALLWHEVACDCVRNQAHFIVPALACCQQAQLHSQHRHAVACGYVRDQARFTLPALACGRQAKCISRRSREMLSHAVAFATRCTSNCLRWLAVDRQSAFYGVAVAYCRMRLRSQPGTLQYAYTGLRWTSPA